MKLVISVKLLYMKQRNYTGCINLSLEFIEKINQVCIVLDNNFDYINANNLAKEFFSGSGDYQFQKRIDEVLPKKEFREKFKNPIESSNIYIDKYGLIFDIKRFDEDSFLLFITCNSNYENYLLQRYELALKGLSVGIWDWDVITNELYWSDRFKEIIGITDKDFIPHFNEFADRLHPSDSEKTLSAVMNHLDKKEPYDIEFRLKHNKGNYVWIHAKGQALWDEVNKAIRMVGSVDDITLKKEYQKKVEESEKFLDLVINNIPDPLFVKSSDNHIIMVNDAFCQLYPSINKQDIVAKKMKKDFCINEIDSYVEVSEEIDLSGEIKQDIKFNGCQKRVFLKSYTDFIDRSNDVVTLTIAKDITKQEKLINQLKSTNLELEEFAYRTSHDLRSPLLSSIKLIAMVRDKLNGQDIFIDECLTHASTSLIKLEKLVEDILLLTKSKRSVVIDSEVNWRLMIDSSLEKFSHMEGFDRLNIYVDIDETCSCSSDLERVQLIIDNYICNSIKYQNVNEKKSYINICVEKDKDNIVFRVSDNGLGIPEEQRNNLFHMFKRFHPRVSFGSGLGLYMIKNSAEIINAKVEYKPLNNGSEFSLRFN